MKLSRVLIFTLFLLLSNKDTDGYISETILNKIIRGTYNYLLFVLLSNNDTNGYIFETGLNKIIKSAYIYFAFLSCV